MVEGRRLHVTLRLRPSRFKGRDASIESGVMVSRKPDVAKVRIRHPRGARKTGGGEPRFQCPDAAPYIRRRKKLRTVGRNFLGHQGDVWAEATKAVGYGTFFVPILLRKPGRDYFAGWPKGEWDVNNVWGPRSSTGSSGSGSDVRATTDQAAYVIKDSYERFLAWMF